MRTSFQPDTQSWPETWQAAYRLLEQSIVPNQLQMWIQPLRFLELLPAEGGLRARIAAPHPFSANWVRDHHLKQIELALSQVTGASVELELVIQEEASDRREPYEPPVEAPKATIATGAPAYSGDHGPAAGTVISAGSRPVPEAMLDPRYTFDSFVVGQSNQFAHASAWGIAEKPGAHPLFLYSPPGLGKTHLLHAIGHRMKSKNPNARVAYLSAETFVNELVESIQRHRTAEFRARYRDSYDLILIDDIQFIAGKNTSEEEFFHTFNALYSSKRQIVLTSDRAPKEIEGLEERIRTRFEWGLIADIKMPEIETRIAILKSKAEAEDIYLPDDVATFLASHVKSSVRELEGVLIKLQTASSLTGAEISLEMAKTELRALLPEEDSNLTVEAIQNAVLKHFRLKAQDLKSTSRSQKISVPRQIAMYLIRKYTGIGYKEIGIYFGGKDHTTVMHGCEKIESAMETDHAIREAVEAIQNLL